MARNFTPTIVNPDGSRTIHVHRYCNGCNRNIGDVTDAEMDASIAGLSLPDVREECGCIPLKTPVMGATCTFGSGKTVWEIVKVNHNQDGTIKDLHLSKYLGDGYTNRWAQVSEIRNLKAQTLRVSLATILALREEAEKAAKKVQDTIRSKARPGQLMEIVGDTNTTLANYAHVYAIHLEDVAKEAEAQS